VLIVGGAITKASDPAGAARAFHQEVRRWEKETGV
jgi:3-keto-L-gulonate-6-phosphate decarboxylase